MRARCWNSDLINEGVGNLKRLHDTFVEDAHATRGNRLHRQFFMAGYVQSTDEKTIERYVERARHDKTDRHTTALQGKYNHIRTIGVGHVIGGQALARLLTIGKT